MLKTVLFTSGAFVVELVASSLKELVTAAETEVHSYFEQVARISSSEAAADDRISCSDLLAGSAISNLSSGPVKYGSLGRLMFLGEVAIFLVKCRYEGASEEALVEWDAEVTNQVNKEFSLLSTDHVFGEANQQISSQLFKDSFAHRSAWDYLMTQFQENVSAELELRLEPSDSLQVVDYFLSRPDLLGLIAETGFCVLLDSLTAKTLGCTGEDFDVLICGVLYQAVSDRMRQCKVTDRVGDLDRLFPGFYLWYFTHRDDDITKVLRFLRGRVRSWFSLERLSPPWRDDESSTPEIVEAVRSVLSEWSADDHSLRPLVTRLWSGLRGCENLPSLAKIMQIWNPYYLMLEEAFDRVVIREGLFAALTFLAGIDHWLSNCRLDSMEQSITEWQSEADFLRNKATVDFFDLVRDGLDVYDYLFNYRQVPADAQQAWNRLLVDPVKGWKLLEESADALAVTGFIVKFESPSTFLIQGAVEQVVDWLSVNVSDGCYTADFGEALRFLSSNQDGPSGLAIAALIALLKGCGNRRFTKDIASLQRELDKILNTDTTGWSQLGISPSVMTSEFKNMRASLREEGLSEELAVVFVNRRLAHSVQDITACITSEYNTVWGSQLYAHRQRSGRFQTVRQ